jgi:hypothetical protein
VVVLTTPEKRLRLDWYFRVETPTMEATMTSSRASSGAKASDSSNTDTASVCESRSTRASKARLAAAPSSSALSALMDFSDTMPVSFLGNSSQK